MKYPYHDACRCEEAQYWEKEARKYKNIVELMNDDKPVTLEGYEQGNTYVLMPVGIAKYKQMKKEIGRYESWMKTMGIWLKNSDDAKKELEAEIHHLEIQHKYDLEKLAKLEGK